jgi:hypothetical protein
MGPGTGLVKLADKLLTLLRTELWLYNTHVLYWPPLSPVLYVYLFMKVYIHFSNSQYAYVTQ